MADKLDITTQKNYKDTNNKYMSKNIPASEIMLALDKSMAEIKQNGQLTIQLEWEGEYRIVTLLATDSFIDMMIKIKEAFLKPDNILINSTKVLPDLKFSFN